MLLVYTTYNHKTKNRVCMSKTPTHTSPFSSIIDMMFDFVILVCIIDTMKDINKSNKYSWNKVINSLHKVYDNISNSLVDIFHSKKNNDIITPIPEKIRYIQRFQQWKVTAKDIEDIINIPWYEMTGIYFTCKYLVQHHGYSVHDMQDLIELFRTQDTKKSITNAKEYCKWSLQAHTLDWVTVDVNTKLRLQILVGEPLLKLVEDKFSKNNLQYYWSTPVIALYAGLQLLPFLQQHFSNQKWIFVDNESHDMYVYQHSLQKIENGETISDDNITIIDDTYWSWNSYNTIRKTLLEHTKESTTIQWLFAIEKWN